MLTYTADTLINLITYSGEFTRTEEVVEFLTETVVLAEAAGDTEAAKVAASLIPQAEEIAERSRATLHQQQ